LCFIKENCYTESHRDFTEKHRVKIPEIIIRLKMDINELNDLTHKIIGCAIEVHKQLGPGLLESAYEECLCYELSLNGLNYERQVPVPVVYKEIKLNTGYRIDVLVEKIVIVELKAIEALTQFTKRKF